jgi:hypothetical protein
LSTLLEKYSVYQINKKEMGRGCGKDGEKRAEYGGFLREL